MLLRDYEASNVKNREMRGKSEKKRSTMSSQIKDESHTYQNNPHHPLVTTHFYAFTTSDTAHCLSLLIITSLSLFTPLSCESSSLSWTVDKNEYKMYRKQSQPLIKNIEPKHLQNL